MSLSSPTPDDDVAHVHVLTRTCSILPVSWMRALEVPVVHDDDDDDDRNRTGDRCVHQPNYDECSYWCPVAVAPRDEGESRDNDLPHQQFVHAPRLLIEQIVQHVYHRHLPRIRGLRGIEWWMHVRHPTTNMYMHFDRDEGLWHRTGRCVHPLLSSVLYVTSSGGPTCIVEQTTDEQITRLDPELPVDGYVVQPIANSWVVFPGSWLHGVIPPLEHDEADRDDADSAARNATSSSPSTPPRITLMMNFWCEPLDDPSCIELSDELIRERNLRRRFGAPIDETNASTAAYHLPIRSVGPFIRSLYAFPFDVYRRDRGAPTAPHR